MIYFDNSATTPMLKEVIQTIQKVQEHYIGNPSSLHDLGVQARQLLEKAREQIANLLHVTTESIYFTSGGTESNNAAILGTAFEKRGKHVITTQIEHPSVTKTMHFLEKMGYTVTYLPVNAQGIVSIEALKAAIHSDTILVSVMWVNNEVGSIQPIQAIAEVLQEYPHIHFHVDAVQAVDDVLKQGIPKRVDLLSLSAHKYHGPRATGILYKKEGRRIQPLLHGGGQEKGLRSGTEHVGNNVAMAKALRLYREKQQQDVTHVDKLSQRLRAFLKTFESVHVLSPDNATHHIVTFALSGVRGEVMVHALEKEKIYISTTSACSSKINKAHHTLSAMNIPTELSTCAVRVSFSYYNTLEELQHFEKVFTALYAQFSKIMK
ncbi:MULTISPECIES: cysteine desulfurase family protein [unclassified Granulicatella]|uniref:cysteine desulfurase family protein n=1 Tax=unclassified Granulicatella TaxID=2630493 RepID=UPI001073521C|nr:MULTISPECIES: cysteine desulfurase family protein [unclassified Granulicatella]MBF0780226.1 cysteine desulfurase [Granulicatella sp. 19428wC4_WM01]TFU95660.1 cysteine desulfurase [Granulicatella sp. WM01]